jgi:hypothetical protein
MKAARPLRVETEVFGEGLGDEHLQTEGGEVTYGEAVVGEVTGSESLVGAVEEGEETCVLNHGRNLAPLILRRIKSSRVVGASLEDDDAASWRCSEVAQHALDVKRLGLLRVVRVVLYLQPSVCEDRNVIVPCRRREVDLRTLEELGEEDGSKVDGAGARNGLEGLDLGSAQHRLTCHSRLRSDGLCSNLLRHQHP